MMADPGHPTDAPSWWWSRAGLAFAVLLGVAVFFLVTRHRAHLFGYWPYLLLLACPLMHLLHHRGHGHRGHGTHGHEPARRDAGRNS